MTEATLIQGEFIPTATKPMVRDRGERFVANPGLLKFGPGMRPVGTRKGKPIVFRKAETRNVKTASRLRVAVGINTLGQVQHGSRLFKLRHPLTNTFQGIEGVWTVKNSYLGIMAYGQSLEETENAFCACFASYWDVIASDKPSNLTEDAKLLRMKLKELVKAISKVR